ncbi:DNA topoisomerase type IIA subunit B domain 2 [Arabidopsis thaliana x Arabidopsis arenosa]|uniref:DNA topoisomerase 2 n=1 Tax=Arabidopsis thaliana x Arabidopsis arenosa TaxID=1240361 RepID=A0A8T1XJN4_9BRAS|nr:DNA topoisomerase type IIA subunit B domain 2 [Arabidopsis thaliana x Arabidopsis arenosa]
MASKLPLQNIDNANVAKAPASSLASAGNTIEHILLCPDSYIGSIEKHTQTLWVYEKEEMVCRSVTYVPGLYKIFDEILVNAADNKRRDPSMDSVKVVIDVEKNQISVCNSGDGVPLEEGVYVPGIFFGHWLRRNYDNNVKKTTGGRNGFGATLTNIFSTEFIIEIADGKRSGKKYKKVFENNMGNTYKPVITKCNKSENWTKVTFKPDLKKFNMTELENDVVALMSKRVLDIAGCLGQTVKVELNEKRVPIKSFSDYVDLYLSAASKSRTEPLPRMNEKVNDRWEVCVSLSDGQFQQVSFVNSIATIKGGTHVDYVTSQVTEYIVGIVNKKKKYPNVKTHNVKNHLWVFVNALIDNPAFDSQTKETLTLPERSFGSKCQLSENILQKVAKSGVVENLLSNYEPGTHIFPSMVDDLTLLKLEKANDQKLREKWFTEILENAKPVEAAVAGATNAAEKSSYYNYLLQLSVLITDTVQEVRAQRDQMMDAVEDLKNATPESLWLKELEELDKQDAQPDEERQAPKKPAPKKASESVTKEASNSAMDTETTETAKEISLDDDDDDVVVSPEKKVRKLRSSPFNKKSSSVMSRLANKEEESSENAAGNSSSEKSGDVFANRGYVWWSDSESESGNESEFDDIEDDEDDE